MKKKDALVQELLDLISEHGYWSKEVSEFNSTLDFSTMNLVNSEARYIYSQYKKYKDLEYLK